MTAKLVAEARRLATDAETTQNTAVAKAVAIRDRIAASQARQVEITALRLAGTACAADAAEYSALGGDIGALQAMLANAEQNVVATNPEKAQSQLRTAEAEHIREQHELAFDALAARAEKLESALLACLADLYDIGRKIKGPSLVMSWRPSAKLARAVSPGVL